MLFVAECRQTADLQTCTVALAVVSAGFILVVLEVWFLAHGKFKDYENGVEN